MTTTTTTSTTTRRRPWWQGALAALLLLLVLAYLYRHRETLRRLPPLDGASWLAIVAATGAGTLVSVLAVQRMLAALATPTPFGEMFLLHNAAHLLNLLPLKAGTLLRASYLRTHHDLSYPRFGVFALYLTLLTACVTSMVGLVCLLTLYGLERPVNRIFAGVLLAASAGTLAVLLLPLPVPRWEGRWSRLLRQLLDARRELVERPVALLPPVACLLTTYLVGVVRLGLIYAGLGLDVHPGGLLLLGALGQVSTLANLTPGGLGVREVLVGGGAAVLGVPVEAGLLVALIERAVGLGWAVLVGLPSAAWVWRRPTG